MIPRRTLAITLLASLVGSVAGCHSSAEVTVECRAFAPARLRQFVLDHLRRTDPIGTKPSRALRTEDIISDGEPVLDDAGRLWRVPFHVHGSGKYIALVDCDGYTELTGSKQTAVPTPLQRSGRR